VIDLKYLIELSFWQFRRFKKSLGFFKGLSTKEGLNINQGFIPRLKHRIYSWYVNSDFILLKFMCHSGSFREDIYKKCVLCKDADNGLKHVVNECAKLKNERMQLLKDLNNINNRKDTELLKAMEFHYYSKSYNNKKEENKVIIKE